jgi:WD40 repeat protein/mono/diheme cytochrome c family protein
MLLLTAVVCTAALRAEEPPKSDTGPISYYKTVRPLLQQHCQGCHQPAKAQGGYVMTDHASLFKAGDSGKAGVTANKPDASYLLDEIRLVDGKAEMPKNGEALTAEQYAKIETWIREGALDDTPAAAKAQPIDAEHPPVYKAAPLITTLQYSPDGSLLAVSGYHEVLLFNTADNALSARLVGLSERVQSLAFSPDGQRLAVAAGDPGRFGEIQIWDVAKARLRISVPVTFDTVYGVSWSPDGNKVAFGCTDNTVRAVDASTGKQVLQMGTHSDWVLGTAFSRDGQHLVSVSRDMTAKLTEVGTERFIDNVTSITPGALKGGLMTLDVRPKTDKATTKVPDDQGGRGVEKSYDELIFGGSDGTPRLYKMHRETKRVIGDDANKIRQYEAMHGRISTLRFDPSGDYFAAASGLDGKGELTIYKVGEDKKAVTCEGITGPVYAVCWNKDGKRIASGGFDGTVQIHDAQTGKLVQSFVAKPN